VFVVCVPEFNQQLFWGIPYLNVFSHYNNNIHDPDDNTPSICSPHVYMHSNDLAMLNNLLCVSAYNKYTKGIW
jgi:hypothetical protein